MGLLISRKPCANGDPSTGANFSALGGYVVKQEAGDFCSLSVANAAPAFGVITVADDATFGRAVVVTSGPAFAKCGATVTPGTDMYVMCKNDGTVIPYAAGAAGTQSYVVGTVASANGAAVASGGLIQINVNPQSITVAKP